MNDQYDVNRPVIPAQGNRVKNIFLLASAFLHDFLLKNNNLRQG